MSIIYYDATVIIITIELEEQLCKIVIHSANSNNNKNNKNIANTMCAVLPRARGARYPAAAAVTFTVKASCERTVGRWDGGAVLCNNSRSLTRRARYSTPATSRSATPPAPDTDDGHAEKANDSLRAHTHTYISTQQPSDGATTCLSVHPRPPRSSHQSSPPRYLFPGDTQFLISTGGKNKFYIIISI